MDIETLQSTIRMLTLLGGGVSTIGIVFSAISYMTSGGDPVLMNRARNILIASGAILVLAATFGLAIPILERAGTEQISPKVAAAVPALALAAAGTLIRNPPTVHTVLWTATLLCAYAALVLTREAGETTISGAIGTATACLATVHMVNTFWSGAVTGRPGYRQWQTEILYGMNAGALATIIAGI